MGAFVVQTNVVTIEDLEQAIQDKYDPLGLATQFEVNILKIDSPDTKSTGKWIAFLHYQ